MALVVQVTGDMAGQISGFLKGFTNVAMKKAAVQSMNRVATTVRKESVKIIGSRLKLPKGGRSSKGGGGNTPPGLKSLFEISKAKYSRSIPLNQIYSSVNTSSKPISLIHFVRGQKAPIPQKGIAVARRKKVVVEVTPGRKVKLQTAFIAKSRRGGAVQVFRRDNNDKLIKQSVPSVYGFMAKPEVRTPIGRIAFDRYKIEFPRALEYYSKQIPRPRKG